MESLNFSVDIADMPAWFTEVTAYPNDVQPMGRVSRASSMQVPAVKRGRDIIAGTLATLPIEQYAPDGSPSTFSPLIAQPERGIPRSVTMARTYEDLMFEGVAWWYVTEWQWNGYPAHVVRLDPRTVSVYPTGEVYRSTQGNTGTVWKYVDDAEIIRFDSPNEGLLTAGARAIRSALALDAAALRYSDGNQPLDYFQPVDNYDIDDDDLDAIMDGWDAARRLRSTGYVPPWLNYKTAGWNPEQLQLTEARQHAVLEIARVMGVDAEDLGVATTSRTYFNAQDRANQLVTRTLRGYMTAVDERLSMGDVTPRGYTARTNLSDLLRADDETRMGIAVQGKDSGLFTDDEARSYFDPTLPPRDPSAIAPAPAPKEIAQ
jgi:phage portal protein BeeE